MIPDRLDKHEVFQFLRPDQVRTISDVAEVVDFRAGETIYERGAKAAHFYVVLQGQISLRLPGTSGVSIQIDELTEGAAVGLIEIMKTFTPIPYTVTGGLPSPARVRRVLVEDGEDVERGDGLIEVEPA